MVLAPSCSVKRDQQGCSTPTLPRTREKRLWMQYPCLLGRNTHFCHHLCHPAHVASCSPSPQQPPPSTLGFVDLLGRISLVALCADAGCGLEMTRMGGGSCTCTGSGTDLTLCEGRRASVAFLRACSAHVNGIPAQISATGGVVPKVPRSRYSLLVAHIECDIIINSPFQILGHQHHVRMGGVAEDGDRRTIIYVCDWRTMSCQPAMAAERPNREGFSAHLGKRTTPL